MRRSFCAAVLLLAPLSVAGRAGRDGELCAHAHWLVSPGHERTAA